LGQAGYDRLDGRGGQDLEVYGGPSTGYALAAQVDGSRELTEPNGTDILVGIGQVQSADLLLEL
jgi:hypothetical protein